MESLHSSPANYTDAVLQSYQQSTQYVVGSDTSLDDLAVLTMNERREEVKGTLSSIYDAIVNTSARKFAESNPNRSALYFSCIVHQRVNLYRIYFLTPRCCCYCCCCIIRYIHTFCIVFISVWIYVLTRCCCCCCRCYCGDYFYAVQLKRAWLLALSAMLRKDLGYHWHRYCQWLRLLLLEQ